MLKNVSVVFSKKKKNVRGKSYCNAFYNSHVSNNTNKLSAVLKTIKINEFNYLTNILINTHNTHMKEIFTVEFASIIIDIFFSQP